MSSGEFININLLISLCVSIAVNFGLACYIFYIEVIKKNENSRKP